MAGSQLLGVNVTTSDGGSKVDEADRFLPADDAACADEDSGPALRLAGVTYPCRRFVPELPGLQAEARRLLAGRGRARAQSRWAVRLLRAQVNAMLKDPTRMPPGWWTKPALLREVIVEASRLANDVYDVTGRAGVR